MKSDTKGKFCVDKACLRGTKRLMCLMRLFYWDESASLVVLVSHRVSGVSFHMGSRFHDPSLQRVEHRQGLSSRNCPFVLVGLTRRMGASYMARLLGLEGQAETILPQVSPTMREPWLALSVGEISGTMASE